MPFTFSHPAIILPLLKGKHKWFSATGLIIGSISPDFDSFIRLNKPKIYSHTWLGVFWFDLPLTIVIALIYHIIVRESLIENLPLILRKRFEQYKRVSWITYFKNHFWIVITSMLIGIVSHLLWDAFTHLNLVSPEAAMVSILGLSNANTVQLADVLQYSNSILGLAIIAWFIFKLPQTSIKESHFRKWQYWPGVIFIACVTLMIEVVCIKSNLNIIAFIEFCIASILIALVIASLINILLSSKVKY